MMDALISTEWLAGQRGARDLRIVDVTYLLGDPTGGATRFAAAHIPGAVFLDLGEVADTGSDLPTMLPPLPKFASRMQALGLGDGTRIVLYDDSPLHSAARAWWMLRTFGLRDVAILDGGLARWIAEGRPTEAGPPAPKPRHLTPEYDALQIRSLDQMRAIVASGGTQIVDARSPARFAGDEPEPRPGTDAGHIPGSRNLYYAAFFTPDGRWKRGEAVTAAFAAAGIDPRQPIVATCGSGITASVLAFAAHLIGGEAAVYDGSWSEWGADPTTPKAKGAA